MARDQADLYERSGGTEGNLSRAGLPVVLLTTVGAKSGSLRKSPLMRVEHNGTYAVVASLAGAPKNPLWYYNVVANPQVELRDGPDKWDMVARQVEGEERELWWARAVQAYPEYAEYQKKTDRLIPIFVLNRHSGE